MASRKPDSDPPPGFSWHETVVFDSRNTVMVEIYIPTQLKSELDLEKKADARREQKGTNLPARRHGLGSAVGACRTTPIKRESAVILFLDFDGRLRPERAFFNEDLLTRLPLIESILREFPDVEIVISSAWRLRWKGAEVAARRLRRHFSDDIATRVVGVTPNFADLDLKAALDGVQYYQRHWGWDAWMRTNRPAGTPWMALDDRAIRFRPSCANLMALQADLALKADHVDEFRQRLEALGRPEGGST